MKKFLLTALVVIATTFSANAQQRVNSDDIEFAPGIIFKVKYFLGAKTTQYGNGSDHTLYIAKPGFKYMTAIMSFSNTTDKDFDIDFEQIGILDSQNKRYYIHGVSQSLKIVTTLEKYTLKLRAGKTKTFMGEFWPDFPKDEKITKIVVFDKVIEL